MNDESMTFDEQSLLVGCGGGSPDICLLNAKEMGAPPRQLCTMADRGRALSVYALDLSPNRTFLAAATRRVVDSKSGEVRLPSVLRVWRFSKLLAGSQTPDVECLSLAGFSDVTVGDDGSLATAGEDGCIRLYEPGADRPVTTVQACGGPLFALKHLTNQRWASLGADGVLGIWRLAGQNLEREWESPPTAPVKTGALQKLAWDPEGKRLFWGDGDGQVRCVEIDGSAPKPYAWSAHRGSVLAMAWHGEAGRLITGGFEDGFIRTWDVSNIPTLLAEQNLHAQIIGLWPMSGSRAAVITAEGKTYLADLDGKTSLRLLTRLPVRSWVGFPMAEIVDAQRQSAQASRQTRIHEIKAAMKKKNWADARARIKQLVDEGHIVESHTLTAHLYRKRGQYLLEYRVWKDMVEKLDEGDLLLSAHYGLGDVLMRLGEPGLAAQEFGLAGEFRDARQRADRAKRHPLFGQSEVIRADSGSHDQFLHELEKCDLLGRQFQSIVMILAEEVNIAYPPEDEMSAEKLADLIRGQAARRGLKGLECKAERCKVLSTPDRPLADMEWVRIRPVGNKDVGPWIQYALAVHRNDRETTLIAHLVFDPGAIAGGPEDVRAWNRRVGELWAAAAKEPAYREWTQHVKTVVENEIIRAHTGHSHEVDFRL